MGVASKRGAPHAQQGADRHLRRQAQREAPLLQRRRRRCGRRPAPVTSPEDTTHHLPGTSHTQHSPVASPSLSLSLHPATVYLGWNDKRNKGPDSVLYGDGSRIAEADVRAVDRIMQEIAVAVPWQKARAVRAKPMMLRSPLRGPRGWLEFGVCFASRWRSDSCAAACELRRCCCVDSLSFGCAMYLAYLSQGDTMLIDNFQAQHSRRPFVPPRKILAYLFE